MADLSSQPTSVQSLYSWFRNDKLIVNRRYQRKLVWTLEEKQKLIDSIRRKYPIPAIFLAEDNSEVGKFEVIDGMQRLHAIMSFIETAFPTEDNEFFEPAFFPTAKGFLEDKLFADNSNENKLTQKVCSAILDYTFSVSIMRNASNDEVNDVFDRINSFGHRLSDQERRQSGVQNDFAEMIRRISCSVRGDVSVAILPLYSMPSVSIDLPKSRHGYEVKAEEVFWVRHGILRSTDLRDSLDEQCVADVAASIVGGSLIDRSRVALDRVYDADSTESGRVLAALKVYGADKFSQEFSFLIQEIETLVTLSGKNKLNEVLFDPKNNNSYPAIFAAVMIAFHELIIDESMVISDYVGLAKAFKGIAGKLDAGQKGSNSTARRINIDTAKGVARKYFVHDKNVAQKVYNDHKSVDIDSIISRSQIETARFELKQGILPLSAGKSDPSPMLEKLVSTACAIANIGPKSEGKIILGVCDSDADIKRVKAIDGVVHRAVSTRGIVGINREAKRLDISIEEYFTLIRDHFVNADMSAKLKNDVLGAIDFNAYFGLGIIVITIPTQKEISFFKDQVCFRKGDQTMEAKGAKEIAEIAKRF